MTERQLLPKQWTLVLDEYEAVNLAAALQIINAFGENLNTGDWVNQIRWKLPNPVQGNAPNLTLEEYANQIGADIESYMS